MCEARVSHSVLEVPVHSSTNARKFTAATARFVLTGARLSCIEA